MVAILSQPQCIKSLIVELHGHSNAVNTHHLWVLGNHLPRSYSNLSSLWWRHNRHDGGSNHQPHDCLLNVYSGADQSKHQSSASLAFVWGIHRGPVNSPHKWPVTQKMFSIDDVIIMIMWIQGLRIEFPEWVSEWLNLMAFLETSNSKVHIVHISCVITAYTLESLTLSIFPHIDKTQYSGHN